MSLSDKSYLHYMGKKAELPVTIKDLCLAAFILLCVIVSAYLCAKAYLFEGPEVPASIESTLSPGVGSRPNCQTRELAGCQGTTFAEVVDPHRRAVVSSKVAKSPASVSIQVSDAGATNLAGEGVA